MSDKLEFDGYLEKLQRFILECHKATESRLKELGITECDVENERCVVSVYWNAPDEYRTYYFQNLPLFHTHIWFDGEEMRFRFELKNGERPK